MKQVNTYGLYQLANQLAPLRELPTDPKQLGRMGHPGDIPGVGGTVDVLTITPDEISWVKRKQLTASAK